MRACGKACPCITEYVHPEDPEARSKPGFWRLKEFVITLSRQSMTEEMENINNETDDCGDISHRAQKKASILSKLKRLLPGSSNTVAAIQRDDGSVTGQAAEMAEALAKHWGTVLRALTIDRGLLAALCFSLNVGEVP